MRNKIMKIINKWDPIDIFPMGPEDEYIREIELIEKIIEDNSEISTTDLAIKIHQLFTKRFGNDIYLCKKEDCIKIASEILDLK